MRNTDGLACQEDTIALDKTAGEKGVLFLWPYHSDGVSIRLSWEGKLGAGCGSTDTDSRCSY